jgi:outer membrane autotransporter protein
VALDELAPSIYADALITARNSWYLMADTISGQLAARRGLADSSGSNSAPGPNSSTIWVSGLTSYDAIAAGGGSPGFTAGLGGVAAGIDVPVLGTARLGAAVGTVSGQTWSQADGRATSSTAQLITYGQWRSSGFFVEAQFSLMYQQENVYRTLPIFGLATRGNTNGLAAGGGFRVSVQQRCGAWLVEPSLGFGGFALHDHSLTETGGGALAESIGGASLGSAQSTLGASMQRGFVLSDAVRLTATARLGWSHEFANDTARVSASFESLNGSGFALTSASIGRDAALIGLDADVNVASWPVDMFIAYGGAINGSSNSQPFDAGLRVTW